MNKSEILLEIEEQEAIINSSAPQDEKDFAQSELNELNAKLAEFKEETKEEEKAIENLIESVPEEKKEELKQSLEEIDRMKELSSSAKKDISAQEQKILDELAEQEAILNSNAPQDEKDFANEEIQSLNAQLAVLREEQPSAELKKRGRKKGWRKIKTEALVAPKEKGKRGRKKGWRKIKETPIAEAQKSKPKAREIETASIIKPKQIRTAKKVKTVPLAKRLVKPEKKLRSYDALKINKLLAKTLSRALNEKGIAYAILGTVGRHTVYVINHESQLNKAYDVYATIADENDVKVKKADTVTRI